MLMSSILRWESWSWSQNWPPSIWPSCWPSWRPYIPGRTCCCSSRTGTSCRRQGPCTACSSRRRSCPGTWELLGKAQRYNQGGCWHQHPATQLCQASGTVGHVGFCWGLLWSAYKEICSLCQWPLTSDHKSFNTGILGYLVRPNLLNLPAFWWSSDC